MFLKLEFRFQNLEKSNIKVQILFKLQKNSKLFWNLEFSI